MRSRVFRYGVEKRLIATVGLTHDELRRMMTDDTVCNLESDDKALRMVVFTNETDDGLDEDLAKMFPGVET